MLEIPQSKVTVTIGGAVAYQFLCWALFEVNGQLHTLTVYPRTPI